MSILDTPLLVEQIDVGLIIPYARNPRKNDAAIAGIAASIREFGFKQPIVIDKSNVIVAGHTRLKAAQQLGLERVPCVRAADLSAEQVKAYRLLDNKLAEKSVWDGELLQLELSELEFDLSPFDVDFSAELEVDQGEVNEDDYVPPDEIKTDIKRGDLIELGEHRVLCGDSTSGEDARTLMGDERANVFITDPPYGVDYAGKNEMLNKLDKGNRIQSPIVNDAHTPEEMSELWRRAFEVAHAITAPDASYYIFGPQGGDLMMMMMSISDANWLLKHMIVWVKNNHVLGRCDYNYKHEPIWFGWKSDGTHKFYGDGSSVSVWEFDKPQKSDLHPTMKPVALIGQAISNSSRTKQLVLDLFLGSGTTLIAADQLSRRCYGIEIEPRYCQVIVDRYRKHRETTGREFICKRNDKVWDGYAGGSN